MKYKCLLIDHDDTVVKSTEQIHYKSFVEYLKIYFPQYADRYSLSDYIEKNFDIGLMGIFRDELSMSDEQIEEEGRFWDSFVRDRIPRIYEGLSEGLHRFAREGGIIAVSSHSTEKYILRDYEANGLPAPHKVYAWDLGEDKRKPSAFAIEDLCRTYGFCPSDILVVDDSKVGAVMARAGGCPFAVASWAYDIPRISAEIMAVSDFHLSSPEELWKLIF